MKKYNVSLTENEVNILRRLLVAEIEALEYDKQRCSKDIEFKKIKSNLNSHIKNVNKLCNKICDVYNKEVTNGKV